VHFSKEPRGSQENVLALLCAGIANPHYNTLSLEYTFDTLIKWVSEEVCFAQHEYSKLILALL
jgi:hypothetical protein